MATGYDCGCAVAPGSTGTCPKFKGTASQIPGNEDALRFLTKAGVGASAAGDYQVEYHNDLHCRNDGNRGQTVLHLVCIFPTGKDYHCFGFHATEAMATELLAQLNGFAGAADWDATQANCFALENHKNHDYQVAETWTRDGIYHATTGLRDKLTAAVAAFAAVDEADLVAGSVV